MIIVVRVVAVEAVLESQHYHLQKGKLYDALFGVEWKGEVGCTTVR